VELAAVRGDEVVAFASRERTLTLAGGSELAVAPLEALPATPHDVLLHFAYATGEHAGAGDAYVATNVAITATVVEAIARQRPRAVVYASSGAVHREGAGDLRADPYGTLKRLDELTLRAAAHDAGAAAIVARVFNVAGPWLLKRGFAIANLIDQVRDGGPVVLRAAHPVVRSYVDVEDLVTLLLALAGAGRDAAFDTEGEVAVEMGELAARVAAVLGRPDVVVEREWDPGAAADRYVGDGTAMRALAAEHGVALRDLDEQIRRTAAGLLAGDAA
jgi:nucleoside-diphosphate-sugar epimerase